MSQVHRMPHTRYVCHRSIGCHTLHWIPKAEFNFLQHSLIVLNTFQIFYSNLVGSFYYSENRVSTPGTSCDASPRLLTPLDVLISNEICSARETKSCWVSVGFLMFLSDRGANPSSSLCEGLSRFQLASHDTLFSLLLNLRLENNAKLFVGNQ
jgi:hypothetical protein